ncbi:lactonase family protein [Sphingobacterium lumbrici]|uniref:lactonase family protein n=1 Tax=Sphingobacterium lumbrici TaxID=2559600 RepID=UPI00112AB8B0|nr:lactonase family protein [Sphingobacterium lumbrici]
MKFFLILVAMSFILKSGSAQSVPLFVGTYTHKGNSEGVYHYQFDVSSGKVKMQSFFKTDNPSFLARSAQYIYAVNEDESGKVSVLKFSNSQFDMLNQLSTEGMHPCHVAIGIKEPVLVVSNYSSGSLVLYSLNADGSIHKKEDFIQFEGTGPDVSRQKGSHVHSAFFNIAGDRLYVSDLGSDRVVEYTIVTKGTDYAFQQVGEIKLKGGSGPRHVAISADANTIYVLAELTGEVAVYLNSNGQWEIHQTLPIYAKGFTGEQGGADVKISPDGKYLYATNRGEANVIVHYKILKNGLLEQKNVYSVAGKSPRNFNFSPDGKFLLVTNQQSDEIVIFNRDSKTGTLTDSKKRIAVGQPVCVIF